MEGRVAGIILAGGHSRRFGEPKAFATKNGVPFYQYSIRALRPVAQQMVIVTNPELLERFLNEPLSVAVITDIKKYQGQGPLAGIYSAMKHVGADWYVVLPIDVPFINHQTIHRLCSLARADKEAVIPVVSGHLQPLIAIYHSSVKEKMKRHLDDGRRSMQSLLEKLNVYFLPVDDETPFININHRTDYQKFIGNRDHSPT